MCSSFRVFAQVRVHCDRSRDMLLKDWMPSAVKLFRQYKDTWIHLVPENDSDSTVLVG